MKYKISGNKIKSKSQMRKGILKWFIYCFLMLLFYTLMRSGAFDIWQPFLIIPLAVSVALRERELPSCIFAMFCGYFIDISCRFIFGFSAVWLMAVCLAASLLSRNLIRINLVNFMLIDIFAVMLEFSMDYLFNVLIWDTPNRIVILERNIFPAVISTILFSPLVYLLIKPVYNKLGDTSSLNNYTPEENSDDNAPDLRDRI